MNQYQDSYKCFEVYDSHGLIDYKYNQDHNGFDKEVSSQFSTLELNSPTVQKPVSDQLIDIFQNMKLLEK